MFDAFISTFSFITAIIALIVVPGWIALRSIFKMHTLSPWEMTVVAFGLGIGLLDLSFLSLQALSFRITPWSISIFLSVGIILLVILRRRFLKRDGTPPDPKQTLPDFSRNEGILFLSMLILTFFLRTLALSETILPTATDLGHHMYWVQKIVTEQRLPDYQKTDLITQPDGQVLLGAPHPIADFIIGEHIPFAALSLLTQQSVFSAFPPLFLSLVNLMSILACLILVWHIGKEIAPHIPHFKPTHLVLATFLLLGPLYALASPQMKFVTGGVIGNIFGNVFIPLVLWSFLRAFQARDPRFFGLGIFFSFLLAYTHHLSTLVLVFLLLGVFGSLAVLYLQEFPKRITLLWQLLKHPLILILLFSIIGFIALVASPSYLERDAIESAVGVPSKTTRTGLSFMQVTGSVGYGKLAFGLAGLVLLLFSRTRKTFGGALLVGWTGMLLVMTLFPQLLFLDIPSNRIGSYLIYPLACTAALAFVWCFSFFQARSHGRSFLIPFRGLAIFFLLLFITLVSNGWYENGSAFPDRSYRSEALLETFRASEYLATLPAPQPLILKDHNYLVGDAWMKLFFQKDYNYPLSRGFLSRYTEGGSRRERCTLLMISAPNTPEGVRCFEQTQVAYIMVNPTVDSAQFEKSKSFSKVFAGDSIAIYHRKGL